MTPIYVAGIAMTVFGRHPERSLHDLADEALIHALADAASGSSAFNLAVQSLKAGTTESSTRNRRSLPNSCGARWPATSGRARSSRSTRFRACRMARPTTMRPGPSRSSGGSRNPMVSWQTTTANLFGRLTVKQLLQRDVSVEKLRAQIGAIERLFAERPPGFEFAHDHPLPHCDAEWVRPRGARTDRVVLHFPGGAYVVRLPNMERAMLARLCAAANSRARLVFYRLAPEHPFPAGHEDCVAAYRQLLGLGVDPARIVLSGISAGGGMALGVLLALRDLRLPMPAGAVLMSPLTDMSDPHHGSRVRNAPRDPVLSHRRGIEMRAMYVGGKTDRMTHPYVSPVFGDFTGLPPLFFQVGSTEILLDDSRRCAEKARVGGVDAEVEVWNRMPHGWHGLPFVPESGRAIERIADFIRERCP